MSVTASQQTTRPPALRARDLVGTWTLVAFESRDATGRVLNPLGPHPKGRLSYDAAGRMSLHLMNPDLPHFASSDRARGTDAEVRAAFVGYLAYYGRYEVDSLHGQVHHRVEGASFPNWVGTDLVRDVRMERRDGTVRLTLTTPAMPVNGQALVTTLVWSRL